MTKLVLTALAALAVLPATALAADPVTGTDRANAARACKTLKASQPALFAATYGAQANAHGKCVSEWAQAAAAARRAATAACQPASARGKGNAFGRCVATQTAQRLNARVRATQNAARMCHTEREAMGATAFADRYGTNRNKANAFGKCVSSLRAQGAQAGRVTATLTGPTGSGSFAAVINLRQGRLCYTLRTTGLTGITAAHIHLKATDAIVVPLATPAPSSRGCATVDAELLRSILQTPGNYYVNVHTEAAPGGALAGDLRR